VTFEVSPKYTNYFKKNLTWNGCETKYILYTTFFEKTSLCQWRFRRNVPCRKNRESSSRGTKKLFTSTFSRLAEKTTRKQLGRSELIRGLTHINEVCEKRNLSWIDSVYHEHSILRYWKIICKHGFSKIF